MTKIEAVKIQAKVLEEKSKKWCSLTCAKRPDYVWLSNGIIIARIPIEFYMLNVPENIGIKGYTTLPEDASEVWLTPMYYKHKEVGTCIRFTADTGGVWVDNQYLKLFCKGSYNFYKGSYNFYIDSKAKNLWLTEPKTRNVVGVIAGIRGINIKV